MPIDIEYRPYGVITYNKDIDKIIKVYKWMGWIDDSAGIMLVFDTGNSKRLVKKKLLKLLKDEHYEMDR